MTRLHIDIETYSPASLADEGVYRYATHPDFRVLLVAYAWDDDPVRIVDLARGERLPDDFIEALLNPRILKCAHNASFERVCLTMYFRGLGVLHGYEWLLPVQWFCTMVQCSRCGLPQSLADAGKVLGFEEQKMTEGKDLIKLFCTPRDKRDTGLFGEDDGRNRPGDFPEKWETFKAYCIRDVEVERQLDKSLSWYMVSDFEQELYALDQRINDRGVLLDLDLVNNAVRLGAIHGALLQEEAMKLTGLDNPNSVSQLKDWVSERTGRSHDTLRKEDCRDLLKETDDPVMKRALQLRLESGKTSNKKYDAMLKVAGKDGRARGLLQFYGSRTGRWAGRKVQLQNLPQNHLAALDDARRMLKAGDTEGLSLNFGNIPDTLSQLIRTALIAPPGKTFAVCDFSAIEARVLAWLAGEDWVLSAFREGKDIYCETASQMFHVPVEKHGRNAALRQKGKIAVLALGYQGGTGALDKMGGARLGMTQAEEAETVKRWRNANPAIVDLWAAVENAARTCCSSDSVIQLNMKHVSLVFAMYKDTMTVRLPSGRLLCYKDMAVRYEQRMGKDSLSYKGVNQTTRKWEITYTHGGKLVENITQAVARDCLAWAMTLIDKVPIPIVFHVHDEVICEVPSPDYLSRIEYCFSQIPPWAIGLPLKGAGYTTDYYKKD